MTIFYKNLKNRPFEAIKKGVKRVEVRANKNINQQNSENNIKEGDVIVFTNELGEKINCIVERITLYKTTRELLEKEGTAQTLSSGKNLEEGVISIESISNYKELIEKNGVFAIKLRYIN
jgi:ASC-1-like (ASCH) protein